MSLQDIESIYWDEIQGNLNKRSLAKRHRIIKMMHEWLPVNTQQHHISGICPKCTCGAHESINHLFSCPITVLKIDQFYSDLERLLIKLKTHRVIINTILVCLTGKTVHDVVVKEEETG